MLYRFVLVFAVAAPAVAAQTAPPGLTVSVEGKVHADVRTFPGGPVGESPGLLLRRARIEATAEADGQYRAVLETDLGEGEVELVDGYVEADIGRGLAARVGRFKTPVGYESLRSSSDLRFAERAFPTALSPRRDLGAMMTWATAHVEGQAGVFNGVRDGASGSDDWGSGADGAARVFARPGGVLDGLGLGVAVAAGTERGDRALADYETPGDRTVFAYAEGVRPEGARLRLAPQATVDVGRVSVLGEWTLARHRVRQEGERVDLAHRAWQVAVSGVLLGVPQRDGRPVPRRPVTDGGAGAIEVSARLHRLTLDADAGPLATTGSARRATAAALAIHWSPTSAARLGLTAERTVFDGFAAAEPLDEARPEIFVVARAQLDL